MDKTYEDHDILVINRKEDKDMVLLSLRDYESLKETAYLMNNPANAMWILESVKQIDEDRIVTKSLTDLGIE